MTDQRFIIEMGMGNDQYGEDYTKAARRAIKDAIRHSNIPMFKALGPTLNFSPEDMRVEVTVAVQKPHLVDVNQLLDTLPHGQAKVQVVLGGLNVTNPDTDKDKDTDNIIVMASAAVEAFLPYLGDKV